MAKATIDVKITAQERPVVHAAVCWFVVITGYIYGRFVSREKVLAYVERMAALTFKYCFKIKAE